MIYLLLNVLLTLALGAGILSALSGWGRVGRNGFHRWGLFYFTGLLAVCLAMYVLDLLHIPLQGRMVGGLAVVMSVVLLGVSWVRRKPTGSREGLGETKWLRLTVWEWILILLILSKALFVATESFSEIRRTDDAYTWSLSLAKHVYFQCEHHSYAMKEGYPRLTGLAMAWQTLMRPSWNEFAPNQAYLALYVFYLILLYGMTRAMLPRAWALGLTYVVAALPLVLTHSVLIGYSDLPMGMAMSMVAGHLYLYVREKRRQDLAIAVVVSLVLPLIKLEGKIPYMPVGIFCAVLAWAYVRERISIRRAWLITAGLAILAAVAAGSVFAIFGKEGPGFIGVEMYKRIYPSNHFMEVLPHYFAHLFWFYSNWMLVGPLALAAILFLAVSMGRKAEFVLVLFCLLNLAGVIYATAFGPGYKWVIESTLINRLLLQVMPAFLLSATVFLWRLQHDLEIRRGTRP
ncbi:hypothetical protein HQ520_02420 [bacterium]|nr:hypothetical protein [bacterium]